MEKIHIDPEGGKIAAIFIAIVVMLTLSGIFR